MGFVRQCLREYLKEEEAIQTLQQIIEGPQISMSRPCQQQQVNLNNHEEVMNGGGGGSNKSGSGGGNNYSCRQTSTKWTPTTDQIRILKDLYYNHGVGSPSDEQIQKISATLRQYGKIEGKNVFYWFQNHKAKKRRKKRFTSEQQQLSLHQQRSCGLSNSPNTAPWRSIPAPAGGFQSPSSSSSSSTSSAAAGMVAGQMGTCGYGSVPMEKSFRDWSISAAGGGCSGGRPIWHNFWAAGADQYHHHQYYPLFDAIDEAEEDQQQNHHELETLPLFPMHGQDIHGGGGGYCNFKQDSGYYFGSWYHRSDIDHHRKAAASLELTLSSFAAMSRDSS